MLSRYSVSTGTSRSSRQTTFENRLNIFAVIYSRWNNYFSLFRPTIVMRLFQMYATVKIHRMLRIEFKRRFCRFVSEVCFFSLTLAQPKSICRSPFGRHWPPSFWPRERDGPAAISFLNSIVGRFPTPKRVRDENQSRRNHGSDDRNDGITRETGDPRRIFFYNIIVLARFSSHAGQSPRHDQPRSTLIFP